MHPKFPDGIYALSFWVSDDHRTDAGVEGLALVRGPDIQGAAPYGAVFHARLSEAGENQTLNVEGSLSVPPDAELITGLRAGPAGLTIPLRATPIASTSKPQLRVEVAGHGMDVEVTYIGPLPSGLRQVD